MTVTLTARARFFPGPRVKNAYKGMDLTGRWYIYHTGDGDASGGLVEHRVFLFDTFITQPTNLPPKEGRIATMEELSFWNAQGAAAFGLYLFIQSGFPVSQGLSHSYVHSLNTTAYAGAALNMLQRGSIQTRPIAEFLLDGNISALFVGVWGTNTNLLPYMISAWGNIYDRPE